MEFARLLHDYIKTFIWPTILLVVVFSYEKEVFHLLENREIDAFGLKIGKRLEDISKYYEVEINDLKEDIKNTDNNTALCVIHRDPFTIMGRYESANKAKIKMG